MLAIQQITTDPRQTQTLVLPDGTTMTLELYFSPMQQAWFITNLVYKTFILRGVRITNNPNILRQWKNIIPFGLACFSAANREPGLAQDFSSGASQLFILTADEVQENEEYLAGD